MSSRLEIELTSARPDGVWTWRKAGAKMPKGEVAGDLLPADTQVGDVLRADVEIMIDGVDIVAVLPPKGARKDRFESLEVVGTRKDEPLVTQTLAPKGRGGGGGGGGRDRGPRRDGDRSRGDRPRGDRPGGDRSGGDAARGDRPRRDRPGGDGARRDGTRRPAPEAKPKAKRLRPGRTHRNAVLDSLAPEQRPIAEHVLRGGVPAVRQAVDKQNETNKAQGLPEIHGKELVALAEGLLPKLRAAEWRDKADNALSILPELDLRDLRSVVVAADTGARDEESRAIAQQLRDGLTRRVEEEHAAWLRELAETIAESRVVRALRLSSRPPKAGAPIPADMTAKLTELATANLTLETSQERWAMVLDALAFSPIRTAVTPVAVPAEVSAELTAAITKVASRVPHIATLFGIDGAAAPKRRRAPAGGDRRPPEPPAPEKANAAAEPTPETDSVETPNVETEIVETESPVETETPVEAPAVAEVDAAEPAPQAEAVGEVDAAEPAPEPEPVAEVVATGPAPEPEGADSSE